MSFGDNEAVKGSRKNVRHRCWLSTTAGLFATGVLVVMTNPAPAVSRAGKAPGVQSEDVLLARGINPHPTKLTVSAQPASFGDGALGKKLFQDPGLSGSGRMSCASCHDSAHAYGPPGVIPVMMGGTDMHTAGFRAVPSLRYLYRQPNFAIGPDTSSGDNDAALNLQQQAQKAASHDRVLKSAETPQAAATNLVPQRGHILGRTRGHAAKPGERAPCLIQRRWRRARRKLWSKNSKSRNMRQPFVPC